MNTNICTHTTIPIAIHTNTAMETQSILMSTLMNMLTNTPMNINTPMITLVCRMNMTMITLTSTDRMSMITLGMRRKNTPMIIKTDEKKEAFSPQRPWQGVWHPFFQHVKRLLSGCLFLFLPLLGVDAHGMEATAIVEKAFDHMRGETSVSSVVMTIHRPGWERALTIRSWTRGKKEALFFIEKPPRDAGNGTLKKGREMWTFNPRVNRVIKLPPSMMSQSWMGSDFSNNDLSKTDSILEDYLHRIIGEKQENGETVYEIESLAREEAPVVWGKQILKIRADGILLSQAFYDEDGELVKIMTTGEIRPMGGRLFPVVWQMRKAGETDRYTRVEYRTLTFDTPLKPGLFTLSSLKRVRR